MIRKHLGMKRPVRQFNKALTEMFEYINAFSFLPPLGDGAKEQAVKEWKQVCNNVFIQLNNIRNTQIELLGKSDKQ